MQLSLAPEYIEHWWANRIACTTYILVQLTSNVIKQTIANLTWPFAKSYNSTKLQKGH